MSPMPRMRSAMREGWNTSRASVEFGEDDAVEIEAGVELFGGVDGILSCHGVDDKEGFVGLGSRFDCCDLTHQGFVDGETAGGVDDDGVVAFGFGFLNGGQRNFDRVALFEIHEDGHLDLFSQHTELFDGGRTIGVAGCEDWSAVLLRFEEKGKFSRKGGLTRTVKAGHEDDGRSVL